MKIKWDAEGSVLTHSYCPSDAPPAPITSSYMPRRGNPCSAGSSYGLSSVSMALTWLDGNHPLLQREVVQHRSQVSKHACWVWSSKAMSGVSMCIRSHCICDGAGTTTHPRPHATATCHSALRRKSDSRSIRDHACNELAWFWRWGVVEMFTFGTPSWLACVNCQACICMTL